MKDKELIGKLDAMVKELQKEKKNIRMFINYWIVYWQSLDFGFFMRQ